MTQTDIILQGKGVQDMPLQIQISMLVTVNVEAKAARRSVTSWLVSEVGNMLMGGDPRLVIGKQTVWRVPALLTSSQKGTLGEVGVVDVDAETGVLLPSRTLKEEIIKNARRLAGSTSSTMD